MNETKTRREFISTSTRGVVGAGLTMTAANWNSVLGANDRIRLGVIGTNNRGSDVMQNFMKVQGVEVVALCDAYDEYANKANSIAGGKAKLHLDYRKLLDDKNIDAVLIATPDTWHKDMAIDACERGKAVYCEKPLTYTVEEGFEIIKAVNKHKTVFQVGLQQRSGDHYMQAKKEYFDNEAIGKVTMVRTWWHGNAYHLRVPKFKTQPAGLDWKRFLGRVKYREFDAHQFYNWRAYLDFGGGQITDLFTHWIDVVHWFMNDDSPIAATASGGVYQYKDGRTAPDTIAVTLEYAKDWTATFEATLVPGGRGAAIEFYGTNGQLYIDRGGYTYTPRGLPKNAAPGTRPGDPVSVKPATNMQQDHVQNFVDCMRSKKTPNSNVVDGHRSAVASHLGNIAYLRKRRITMEVKNGEEKVKDGTIL
jgi:predicted dehydrogenase